MLTLRVGGNDSDVGGRTTKIVTLGALDLMKAAHMAGLFRGIKKVQAARGHVSNRRSSNLDDFGIHYIGAMGEVAVSKALNIPVRDDVTVYGDGYVDMEISGQRVQIKTSSHASLSRERLVFVDSMAEFKADWLVACSTQSPYSVGIHGFISRRKFERLCFEHDFGYGPRVAVRESSTTHIDLFMEALASKEESCSSSASTPA